MDENSVRPPGPELATMGQTLACLPCGREPVARMFPSLESRDPAWNWDSTAQLYNHTRPGGVLQRAGESQVYQDFLRMFMDPAEPLDLVYASIHTYWIHQSNIALRSLRIVRYAPAAAPGTAPQQIYYLDDVREGVWIWEAPQWLGLMRDNAAHPGSVRWFDSAPGSFGFVHRSDVASEMHWQMTLVPVCDMAAYNGVMLPLAQ